MHGYLANIKYSDSGANMNIRLNSRVKNRILEPENGLSHPHDFVSFSAYRLHFEIIVSIGDLPF